jgi:hypothetical protein
MMKKELKRIKNEKLKIVELETRAGHFSAQCPCEKQSTWKRAIRFAFFVIHVASPTFHVEPLFNADYQFHVKHANYHSVEELK